MRHLSPILKGVTVSKKMPDLPMPPGKVVALLRRKVALLESQLEDLRGDYARATGHMERYRSMLPADDASREYCSICRHEWPAGQGVTYCACGERATCSRCVDIIHDPFGCG